VPIVPSMSIFPVKWGYFDPQAYAGQGIFSRRAHIKRNSLSKWP
jgi:hypothetical protein